MPRRFLPPWTIIELAEAFAIVDASGQRLAYVYFVEDAARGTLGALARDEARRIAAGIARLPGLIGKGTGPKDESEAEPKGSWFV